MIPDAPEIPTTIRFIAHLPPSEIFLESPYNGFGKIRAVDIRTTGLSFLNAPLSIYFYVKINSMDFRLPTLAKRQWVFLKDLDIHPSILIEAKSSEFIEHWVSEWKGFFVVENKEKDLSR
jgi:hypothetical protein